MTCCLAHRLGLVSRPEGRFEDFIVLDPNRDLPRYAVEDPESPGRPRVGQAGLSTLLLAHHAAGVFGLVADRVADGQVDPDGGWSALLRALTGAWRATLSVATKGHKAAEDAVDEALSDLLSANQAEQTALARAAAGQGLSPLDYVSFSISKLRWFGACSHAWLVSIGEPERAQALRRAYDTFSIGLQLIDDALDCPSDRQGRGIGFPDALGVPPGGMLAAAPFVIARAASRAKQAGFHELGLWLDRFSRSIGVWALPGDPVPNALSAALLEAAVCEVIP